MSASDPLRTSAAARYGDNGRRGGNDSDMNRDSSTRTANYPCRLALLCSLVWATSALAADRNVGPPNFGPNSVTGLVPITYGDLYEPPPSGPGPVTDDPAHPFVSNREFAETGRQPTFHIA